MTDNHCEWSLKFKYHLIQCNRHWHEQRFTRVIQTAPTEALSSAFRVSRSQVLISYIPLVLLFSDNSHNQSLENTHRLVLAFHRWNMKINTSSVFSRWWNTEVQNRNQSKCYRSNQNNLLVKPQDCLSHFLLRLRKQSLAVTAEETFAGFRMTFRVYLEC